MAVRSRTRRDTSTHRIDRDTSEDATAEDRIERELLVLANELRDETAQVLSSALLYLATIRQRPNCVLDQLELDALCAALKGELSRVLAIISKLAPHVPCG